MSNIALARRRKGCTTMSARSMVKTLPARFASKVTVFVFVPAYNHHAMSLHEPVSGACVIAPRSSISDITHPPASIDKIDAISQTPFGRQAIT